MTGIMWHHGVPWARQAAESARSVNALDAVTDVARGLIELAKHDPSSLPGFETGAIQVTQRGEWIAIVSPDLVVVGHGRAESGLPAVWDDLGGLPSQPRGARGPKTYDELIEWLDDEGYETGYTKNDHRYARNSATGGQVTLAFTPSDHRSLLNDVALCRRELGAKLRRHG